MGSEVYNPLLIIYRMPIPFEFVIDGPPLSLQARRSSLRRWTQDLKSTASQQWGTSSPFTEDVAVTITNFFYGEALDVDNMAKPILDALKLLIYADDSQVTDLLCRKRDRDGDLRIPNPSQVLLERLSRPGPFVHIFVDNALNQEVTI